MGRKRGSEECTLALGCKRRHLLDQARLPHALGVCPRAEAYRGKRKQKKRIVQDSKRQPRPLHTRGILLALASSSSVVVAHPPH